MWPEMDVDVGEKSGEGTRRTPHSNLNLWQSNDSNDLSSAASSYRRLYLQRTTRLFVSKASANRCIAVISHRVCQARLRRINIQ